MINKHDIYLDSLAMKIALNIILKNKNQIDDKLGAFPGFVNIKDGRGKWLFANDFAKDLFEIKLEDYKGKKILKLQR